MSEQDVINLMTSSKSEAEWNQNCDRVKKHFGDYPPYWYSSIILSGLMDKTLGKGASDLKVFALKNNKWETI